ncbi:hypothetical protein QYE76_022717 [Lolium multiflorum]|uniref:Uncharacterized protein n=1 Tax=Lolium multiflorum TaxID=4521 RepID=A0AAD8RAF2_LOLMU|nr:hypothetical protein QYE76_022717 [Lolium multiflorum]
MDAGTAGPDADLAGLGPGTTGPWTVLSGLGPGLPAWRPGKSPLLPGNCPGGHRCWARWAPACLVWQLAMPVVAPEQPVWGPVCQPWCRPSRCWRPPWGKKWRLLEFTFGGHPQRLRRAGGVSLWQRIYSMDFINDNAGCFANGGKFLRNGRIIEFGSHRVYFGTVPVPRHLSVPVAPDPPRKLWRKARTVTRPPNHRRSDEGAAGTSTAPPETPLQAAMHELATPITQNIDPAVAQAELEATRKRLLSGGANIIRAQRELNLTLREYNAAHGFATVSAQAARVPENRLKARNLDQDLQNNKPGHTRPEEKAMGQVVAVPEMAMPEMPMPETIMPVDMKPGKIIELQGQRMLKRKCHHQGTGRQEPRNRQLTQRSTESFRAYHVRLWEKSGGCVIGGRDNCRVENILFEVVDLDSPYHALLGRPALAAFKASTHTAYLKMKMPAPRGPLTVVKLQGLTGNRFRRIKSG